MKSFMPNPARAAEISRFAAHSPVNPSAGKELNQSDKRSNIGTIKATPKLRRLPISHTQAATFEAAARPGQSRQPFCGEMAMKAVRLAHFLF